MNDLTGDNLDFRANASDSRPPFLAPPPATAADGRIAGERGISPIAGRFGIGKGGKALAFLGLVVGSGIFLAATWSHPHIPKPKTGASEPVKQVVDFASVRATPSDSPRGPASPPAGSPASGAQTPPSLAEPGVGAPALTRQGEIVPALMGAGPDAAPGAAPAVVPGGAVDSKVAAAQQAAAAQAAKLQAIRSAPLVAFSSEVRAAAAGEGSDALTGRLTEGGGGSELDGLRRGSTIGVVRAQRLPDRTFLITAGALLPCVLETALDTSAPGFVSCRIPRDVYSDNGGVVLMEKGSRVLGEYRSGFQQGRARIFILWDRITTPDGVAVDVSSPASDALGRAGFDGKVDSHFWQRFGGALLLTSVSSGVGAAAAADARFANVAQAPNEAAAAALQNSVTIPPTLTKPQGSEVAILVSRDLDFSGVYALKGR